MAHRAQEKGQVANPGPHVSPLATTDFQFAMVPIAHLDETGVMDFDLARFEDNDFAAPRQVIGPLTLDLDGGIGRRYPDNGPGGARHERRGRFPSLTAGRGLLSLRLRT